MFIVLVSPAIPIEIDDVDCDANLSPVAPFNPEVPEVPAVPDVPFAEPDTKYNVLGFVVPADNICIGVK